MWSRRCWQRHRLHRVVVGCTANQARLPDPYIRDPNPVFLGPKAPPPTCVLELSPQTMGAQTTHLESRSNGSLETQVHDVVDGKQRLTTLRYFREGHWPDDPKAEFRLQVSWLKEPSTCAYPSPPCAVKGRLQSLRLGMLHSPRRSQLLGFEDQGMHVCSHHSYGQNRATHVCVVSWLSVRVTMW